MQDPKDLREQARKCRALAQIANDRELIEQLQVWSVDLGDEADEVERTVERKENLSCG
jgi:hypothetical protein